MPINTSVFAMYTIIRECPTVYVVVTFAVAFAKRIRF